jgi:hypothetical protein
MPVSAENPTFTGFQNLFSDLRVEIYLDTEMSAISDTAESVPAKSPRRQSPRGRPSKNDPAPITTLNLHKLILSWHSKYMLTMLSSGMREGGKDANTIRLTTPYPESLRKLLQSFYEHVLEIRNAEELIEFLFLADEYDVPAVRTALLRLFTPNANALELNKLNGTVSSTPTPRLDFTLENARVFLNCSSKLNLKLEPRIFAGVARQWGHFRVQHNGAISEFRELLDILKDSLKFQEEL